MSEIRNVADMQDDPDGWLYFIQQGDDDGPFKIGRAKNPRKRLDGLQTGNPVKLRIVAAIEGAGQWETQFHKALEHARIGDGEWFYASAVWPLIDWIYEFDPPLHDLLDFARGVA